MKMSHKSLLIASGCIWLAIGLFLLPLGLKFIVGSIEEISKSPLNHYPLISSIAPFFGGVESAGVILIATSLMLGTMKAKMVLSKVVVKGITRIKSLPNPANFTDLYGLKYLLLVAFMMSLGMAMRYFDVPKDVRGVIDIAVGSALITGGITYFRSMSQLHSEVKST
ncbi:MAG: hypothetical protein VX777_05575 [Chlamydiota bacterium]|nr:hypothetical protein [Chlamydiota bacterium]